MPSKKSREAAIKAILAPSRSFAVRSSDPNTPEGTAIDEDEGVEPTWFNFESSRVAAASYDKDAERLFVRFVKPTPGLIEYAYEGVSANQWRNFRRSPSAGRYINNVLNNHPYYQT